MFVFKFSQILKKGRRLAFVDYYSPSKWKSTLIKRPGKFVVPEEVKNAKKPYCMAIRRETINPWERRAPLAPKHVKWLTRSGVKVLVQPSNRRAYPMQRHKGVQFSRDYISAGAISSEDISEASLIMSVKTVPIEDLIPDKTYVFFSHTIKAQKDNMPLLDAVLQNNIRLIDYEKMVDEKGQRIVMFGRWAGYAGMIDILHGLGLRLLALGHNTPFLHIGLAHSYRDSHMAHNAVRDVGYEIALGCMPKSLGPLTFVFTGTGNVSQGAQEIFQSLPTEYVDVANLHKVAQYGSLNKVYGCVVSRADHLSRINGGGFDAEEYDAHPELYKSNFATEVAPYTSVLINGIYWAPKSPRLITLPDATVLMSTSMTSSKKVKTPGRPRLPHRLVAICDISADPGGSVEFMTECTTIDRPFCIYDANQHKSHDSFALPTGVLVCSIDNMPAQMPLESTEYFGDLLMDYIFEMLLSDATTPFEKFQASDAVTGAIIASNGKLTPKFAYISDLRRQKAMASYHKAGRSQSDLPEKSVLLLGAGFVSAPVVEYLSRAGHSTKLTVVTEKASDIEKLIQISPEVKIEIMNVFEEQNQLSNLIEDSDLVIR
uniref:Saccharopine dehydrogenase (NAD(+), L-glutamate-forming) n=1 Tax=Romanomermis culicivorax TaxID=13658 RepID=A0A915IGW7_ROMCU